MKKNLQLLKIALFSVFLIIFGCREEIDWKTNQQEFRRAEEFFKNNGANNKNVNASLVSSSIQKLKKINDETNFLSEVSDKYGLPAWNFMMDANIADSHHGHHHNISNKGEEETTETLIIPLRQEDNFLSSLMYVENPNSENPTIYTVTNEQLQNFVKDETIDNGIRESVLMTFIYFDHEIFGERNYSSIPQELFDNIPLNEGKDYKTFGVDNTEVSTTSNKQIMICVDTHHCKGCQGACDECPICVSTYCYTTGTTGPSGPSNPGNPGDTGNNTGGGGTGSNNTPTIPWYVANPNIYNYNGNVRAVFVQLYNKNIQLQDEELDYLENHNDVTLGFKSYLSNITLEKAQFVKWGIEFLLENQNVTWSQFQNLFMKTPCEKVKNKFTDNRFKTRFQDLTKDETFNLKYEKGAYEKLPAAGATNSNFTDISGNANTTYMDLPSDKSGIVGLMHSHNNSDDDGKHMIKIFSPVDVRTFLNHLMPQANSYIGSYANAYSLVTTSEGNYMLQYTKNTWPGSINYDTKETWQKWYDDEYQKLVNEEMLTQTNVEKVFTQFLKEVVNISGLEIYRVSENSSTKLEYDGKDNPVKPTPCP